jgi:hypothetical protein
MNVQRQRVSLLQLAEPNTLALAGTKAALSWPACVLALHNPLCPGACEYT